MRPHDASDPALSDDAKALARHLLSQDSSTFNLSAAATAAKLPRERAIVAARELHAAGLVVFVERPFIFGDLETPSTGSSISLN